MNAELSTKSHRMHTFPIRKVVTHHARLKSFYFEQTFPIVPGQFVNLWLPGVDEKPFSVSNCHDGLIEITVKAVGPYTHALLQCEPGALIGIRGPFGHGFKEQDATLVVGGGMGIAPLRYLVQSLQRSPLRYWAICGARTREELIFLPEWEVARTSFATDDGSFGEHASAVQLMRPLLEREHVSSICACGPEPMLLAVRALADECHVPFQLSFERYMKCGIGICGSCCLDGSGIRVCNEGPVLTALDLAEVTELGVPHRDASGRRE